LNGHGAASVRSLADADGGDTLELSDLSERSVIALVGLAFEAQIAAGPGVLVICRGRETSALLQLAISADAAALSASALPSGLHQISFLATAWSPRRSSITRCCGRPIRCGRASLPI